MTLPLCPMMPEIGIRNYKVLIQQMKKIRVALIVTKFMRGGVQSIVEQLAVRLDPERFEVVLISLNDRGSYTSYHENIEGKMLSFGINHPWDISKILRAITYLRNEKVVIAHTHPGTLSRLIAILAGCPVIVSTWHGTYGYRFLSRTVARFLARQTSIFVANSSYTRGYNTAALRLPENKSVLIYNGVDAKLFQTADKPERQSSRLSFRQSMDIDNAALVVCSIGRLHADKGFDVLIKAMTKVKEANANSVLMILGNGEMRDQLEKYSGELRVADSVRFYGDTLDVKPFLGASDIFVMPSSKREGFGLALVEAMLMEVPVVGSDLGGIPEIIHESVSGLLFTPGDSNSLASSIMRLWNDKDMLERMKANSRNEALQKFAADRMVSQYQTLYNELYDRI